MRSLRVGLLLAALAVCSAQLASTWPERPLSKDVELEQHYASQHHAHLRALAEAVVHGRRGRGLCAT